MLYTKARGRWPPTPENLVDLHLTLLKEWVLWPVSDIEFYMGPRVYFQTGGKLHFDPTPKKGQVTTRIELTTNSSRHRNTNWHSHTTFTFIYFHHFKCRLSNKSRRDILLLCQSNSSVALVIRLPNNKCIASSWKFSNNYTTVRGNYIEHKYNTRKRETGNCRERSGVKQRHRSQPNVKL